jgi:DNA (cytosine-5)-methyltransferase 1
MTAYYNEFDPKVAAWLRELIKQGHIVPGVVDERSIEDVRPSDLAGFKQCHFFAGIGVWSYALRRAGWADDRPVWTGSCPCQPFSAAGKGAAFDDERHLWPAFHHLIKVCKPAIVLGEQVASKAVDDWVDLVHADVEALGYTFGSVPFPSAGVGAPHIRDRNYWVANSNGARPLPGAQPRIYRGENGTGSRHGKFERSGAISLFGNAGGTGLAQRQRQRGILGGTPGADKRQAAVGAGISDADGLAYAEHNGRGGPQGHSSQPGGNGTHIGLLDGRHSISQEQPSAGPINGFWRAADWLACRDGKWRPVESGTFPLAHGAAARVVRLRGYGNAVNAQQAQAWIETVMECIA